VLEWPQVVGRPVGQAQALAVQVALAGQAFPQLPQLALSVASFTQAPGAVPQTVSFAGHLQSVLWQVAPVAQTVAQVPQCFGSEERETQVPGVDPQTSGRASGHLQAPARQTSFVSLQTVPQLMQLFGSVLRSVQVVPHLSGLGARHWQVPPWHCAPVSSLAQAWPQLPQLARSSVGSTHSGDADGQEVTGEASQAQAPPEQVPRPQACPHFPQSLPLVCRSTQAPSQTDCPVGH
jgi:hypothetical protein